MEALNDDEVLHLLIHYQKQKDGSEEVIFTLWLLHNLLFWYLLT